MKYLSLSTVVTAYNGCYGKTKNQFWGTLFILKCLNSRVSPVTSYRFNGADVSKHLEDIFCPLVSVGSYKTDYYYVLFSNDWLERLPSIMFKEIPNIWDVCIWFFRNRSFNDETTKEDLINLFLKEINLTKDDVKNWFKYDERKIEFYSSHYFDSDLIKSLGEFGHVYPNNGSLSFEKKSGLTSKAGQLTAANFVQSLYSALTIEECLILTKFDFPSLYKIENIRKRANSEEITLQQIFYGAPGTEYILSYLSALRSKPFMILAGISGTGKSRIVREFAYMTCPKDLQDKDGTTPGNYCMIEVKPNWHDSTELLGYYSAMNKEYVFTKFDRFVVKAWLNPETPFFVCLDEMNLAPVEQYFAEFLSVLETRSRDQEGNIASGALIEAKYFDDSSKMAKELGLDNAGDEWTIEVRDHIVNKGLTLPPNLMVIGTVNMDDTTYQFSRKVIDRAMTIEMNGGELKNMFGNSRNLQYRVDPIGLSAFKARYLNADEVVEAHAKYANSIRELLPQKIEGLNKVLEYTPFQVSYRVLNELVVYTGVLLDEAKAKGAEINFEQIAANAFDQITLMKILPRIEGDEDMFIRGGQNVLANLQSLFAPESASYKKLTEMKERLERTGFTRFWP